VFFFFLVFFFTFAVDKKEILESMVAPQLEKDLMKARIFKTCVKLEQLMLINVAN